MPTFPTPGISELAPFVAEGHWIETLRDGSHVLIRPLQPEDRQREVDFIARLSPEARHFRFLGTIKAVSPELLDRLMAVDYRNSMAVHRACPPGWSTGRGRHQSLRRCQ